MSAPIVYVDRSRIRSGKLGDLRRAIDDIVAYIETREPQLLSYGFYVDEEAATMTVVAVHPDAASVETHMEVGGAAFRGFADLIEMEAIEVYGEPSARMLRLLEDKARALGSDSRVVVSRAYAGFSRLGPPAVTQRF